MLDFDVLTRRAAQLASRGVRGRYAPSPTGPLHLGNARTALLAWMQVRLQGGVFVLRMEDLDRPREKPGSADQIIADLKWMGLDWDEGPDTGGPVGPYVQCERDAYYENALRRLMDQDLVFPCYCSRKDIRAAASAPHGATPVYPGTCRPGSNRDAGRASSNRRSDSSWRFQVDIEHVGFRDELVGDFFQDLGREVGDFVIRRSDRLFAYQLAVVVDDALMGITDVVRGMDLMDSTLRQIALFHALRFDVPRFWHVPLVEDGSGERLSKRDGGDSIQAFRDGGGSPPQLVGRLAASVGLVPPGRDINPRELLDLHDIESFKAHLKK